MTSDNAAAFEAVAKSRYGAEGCEPRKKKLRIGLKDDAQADQDLIDRDDGTQTATLLPCCCCLVQPIKNVLRCGHGVCDTCGKQPDTRTCPSCKQAARGSPIKLFIFRQP